MTVFTIDAESDKMPEQRTHKLSQQEQRILLQLAREAVVAAAYQSHLPHPKIAELPAALLETAACFVTLRQKQNHDLRGCTGILTAQRPLFKEVIRTASYTAISDPRFSADHRLVCRLCRGLCALRVRRVGKPQL